MRVGRHVRGGIAGFTMVEVVVASAIILLMALGFTTSMLYVLNTEKSVIMKLRFTHQAKMAVAHMNREILGADGVREMAQGGVTPGTRLEMDHTGLPTAAFYFEDLDGIADTLQDNRLVYDPDIATDDDEKVLVRFVSQVGTQKYFEFASETQPIRVRFRAGDRSNAATRENNQYSGKGYQAIVVQTAFARRRGA